LKLPVLSGQNYQRGGVESNTESNQADSTLTNKTQQAHYQRGFQISVQVNRTRITLMERIDADLFWFYLR
jgi:hypothetical protein